MCHLARLDQTEMALLLGSDTFRLLVASTFVASAAAICSDTLSASTCTSAGAWNRWRRG